MLGDAIQQHDSRLSEGGNAQYQHPHVADWGMGFFTAGVNFLASHNNVDLRQRVDRNAVRMFTSAHAKVYNGGAYVQERVELLNRKLELGGGLRFALFSYSITDFLEPEYSGVTNSPALQPKAFAAFTPSHRVPVKLFFNYGRGIASTDARGAVRNPDGPFINKLDFFQVGVLAQVPPKVLTDDGPVSD